MVHGMQGFHYDRAKEVLRVADEYQVEAMAAVGEQGRPASDSAGAGIPIRQESGGGSEGGFKT